MPHPMTAEALVAALWSDAWGALAISGGILALFVMGELLHRLAGAPVEYTRKLSHVGSGAIVLSFPWVIDSVVTVGLLAASFLGLLVLGKTTGLLGSVHGVARRTGGAYYYPVAVLASFWLADGDALLYCVPMAIMAVADTGAAIVGQELGETRFQVLDGERSFEGSATFFGLAFFVVLVALSLAQRPGWPEMLLVALVTSVLTTAVEAVSVRGSDNLLIPYMSWMVMERTLRLGLPALSSWILGMLLALAIIVITWRRAGLTPAGALLTFVLASLAYAQGGAPWFLPLATLYSLSLFLRRPVGQTGRIDLNDVFPTAAGSMVLVLAFAHSGSERLYLPFLVTVSANAAVALGLAAVRRRALLLPAAVAGALLPAAWRVASRRSTAPAASASTIALRS